MTAKVLGLLGAAWPRLDRRVPDAVQRVFTMHRLKPGTPLSSCNMGLRINSAPRRNRGALRSIRKRCRPSSKPAQLESSTTVDRRLDLTACKPDIAQSTIVHFSKRFDRVPARQIRGQAVGPAIDPGNKSARPAGSGGLRRSRVNRRHFSAHWLSRRQGDTVGANAVRQRLRPAMTSDCSQKSSVQSGGLDSVEVIS